MTQTVGAPAARRILLDEVRGATLVSMIAYHLAWDLVNLFGVDWPWYHGLGAFVWQQSICWTFILLSGFCVDMGRRPLRRGAVVSAAGALVSAVTWVAMPESRISFGVLFLLGLCMMAWAAVGPLMRRVPAGVGLALSAAAFCVTRNVNDGGLGFGGWTITALPEGLYRNWLTTALGFPMPGFYSSDYFSLLPWGFLFLAGHFLWRLAGRYGLLERLPGGRVRPLAFLGRHSLLIYLLHQPAGYLLLQLVM